MEYTRNWSSALIWKPTESAKKPNEWDGIYTMRWKHMILVVFFSSARVAEAVPIIICFSKDSLLYLRILSQRKHKSVIKQILFCVKQPAK